MAEEEINTTAPTVLASSETVEVAPSIPYADANSSAVEPSSAVIDRLSGQQKVAAILVAMGKDAASKLLQHFSKEDLRLLTGKAQTLPDMSLSDFEVLVDKFEDSFAKGVSLSEVGQRFKQLILDTLPEEDAAEILSPQKRRITGIAIKRSLEGMAAEKLNAYIGAEHPQVIAYILSKLSYDVSAKLLLMQEPELRSDIIQRQLRIRDITPAAESILESTLTTIFTKSDGSTESVHYNQVASILNELSKPVIEETLENLKHLSPDDIEGIKARIFIFEDIIKLSHKARLILFNDIPIDMTVLALRRTDAALTECILNALSPRSRRMAETELSTPDDQFSQGEIEAARRFIAQEAIKLSDLGTISLHPASPGE